MYKLRSYTIVTGTRENFISKLISAITQQKKVYVCVTGLHGIVAGESDARAKNALSGAAYVVPDGMPLVWAGRAMGQPTERFYGPDLMRNLCDVSVRRGYRIFLYGTTETVLVHLKRNLKKAFPGLTVVGTMAPPYRPLSASEASAVIGKINRAAPDIVFVGMSTPVQEVWMHEFRDALRAPVLIGVGAAFDFLAGTKKQAPTFMRRLGFEWLYRLVQEPVRLLPRYLNILLRFPGLFMSFMANLFGHKTPLRFRYGVGMIMAGLCLGLVSYSMWGQRQFWPGYASYGGVYSRPIVHGHTLVYGTSYTKLYFVDIRDRSRVETMDFNTGTVNPRFVVGRMLYGTSGDTVWAVDMPSRTLRWSFSIPGQYEVDQITYARGTILVAGTDGIVYALRARDGDIRWNHTVTKSRILSEITVGGVPAYFGGMISVGDSVYAAGSGGTLYALNSVNGRTLWKRAIGTLITAGPDYYGNVLLIGTKDGRTMALNRHTGDVYWTSQEQSPVTQADVTISWWLSKNPAVRWVAPAAESLRQWIALGSISYFEVHNDGTLVRRDGKTGRVIWRAKSFGTGVNMLSRWFDTGMVTTAGGNAALLSLRTGKILWKRSGFGSIRQQAIATQWFSLPSLLRPFLPVRWIFGDMDGVVRSLDGKTGRTVWSFQAMGPIYSRPGITDRRIYIATADGLVYQLNGRTGQPLAPKNAAQFTVSRTVSSVGADHISEFTVVSPTFFDNPWWEAQLEARFTHESGLSVTVPGFYYDGNIWKIRFNPPKTGVWRWRVVWKPYGKVFTREGTLRADTDASGSYIRISGADPKRFTLDGKTIFNGLGLGDTLYDANENGTPLDDWTAGNSEPFVATDSAGAQIRYKSDRINTADDYIRIYGPHGAGFNMFRWSILNGSSSLWRDLGFPMVYSVRDGKNGDDLVRKFRNGGFHVWLTMFGFDVPFQSSFTESEKSLLRSYVRYIVARYGAYVDVWELANEDTLPPRVISFLTEALREFDAMHHPVSTSFEEPERNDIDIIDSHWYASENEAISDSETVSNIRKYDRYDKPVVFGEQGNKEKNWDPTSALRMRVRAWTAFYSGGILMFWNKSDTKGAGYGRIPNANQYIGDEERAYMRILQQFTVGMPIKNQRLAYNVEPYGVRGCGLAADTGQSVYFYHYADPEIPVSVPVSLSLARSGVVRWISPSSGEEIAQQRCPAGMCILQSPLFRSDIALKITYE